MPKQKKPAYCICQCKCGQQAIKQGIQKLRAQEKMKKEERRRPLISAEMLTYHLASCSFEGLGISKKAKNRLFFIVEDALVERFIKAARNVKKEGRLCIKPCDLK